MKRIILALLCFTSMMFSVAQPPQTAVTIQSEKHEHFWLYINNELQNERSDEAVIVKNLAPSNYNFTIVIDNRQQTTLNTQVQLHTGINYFEVAYRPGENKVLFRSADKDAEAAGAAINAFGNMVYQMNAQYEADVHHQHHGDQHHGDHHHGAPNQGAPNQGAPNYGPQGHGNHGGNHNNGHTPVPPPAPAPTPAPAPAPVVTPPPAPAPMPCNDNDFMEIKQLIRSETFEDSKLTVAKQATAAELLTVDQLAEIASLFTFEDTKLEYLKYAYNYCFDPNKYYKLNKVFTYSSSVDELNDYIRGK